MIWTRIRIFLLTCFSSFWISLIGKQLEPDVTTGDDEKLLQLATTYLCESGFSYYYVTKIGGRRNLEATQMEGYSCHIARVWLTRWGPFRPDGMVRNRTMWDKCGSTMWQGFLYVSVNGALSTASPPVPWPEHRWPAGSWLLGDCADHWTRAWLCEDPAAAGSRVSSLVSFSHVCLLHCSFAIPSRPKQNPSTSPFSPVSVPVLNFMIWPDSAGYLLPVCPVASHPHISGNCSSHPSVHRNTTGTTGAAILHMSWTLAMTDLDTGSSLWIGQSHLLDQSILASRIFGTRSRGKKIGLYLDGWIWACKTRNWECACLLWCGLENEGSWWWMGIIMLSHGKERWRKNVDRIYILNYVPHRSQCHFLELHEIALNVRNKSQILLELS